jgi:hypothetical protein
MALLDLSQMRKKSELGQWSLDDIDWSAPGREAVTPEHARRMERFLGDLVWIETFGTSVFRAMAGVTKDPDLRAIYESFAVDEARHAAAEQRLMVRWGLLPDGVFPEPNPNARIAIEFLDRHSSDVPFAVYATLLPMFEIALDGALLQFLNSSVEDPVCHRVFERVNRDEARHLAVDFHTLEVLGRDDGLGALWSLISALARPSMIRMLAFGYLPLLERAVVELRRMGVPASDLAACIRKFRDFGKRHPAVAAHPTYRLVAAHAAVFAKPDHPYHWLAAALVWLSDVLGAVDSWTPRWAPLRLIPVAT